MAENREIKTREIVNEIIDRYGYKKIIVKKELLVKEIRKICEKIPASQNGVSTNLWECSNAGKNKEHLFTKAEMDYIVTHYELCKYLLDWKHKDNGPIDKAKTEKKLQALVDKHDRVMNRIKSETEAFYDLHEPLTKTIVSHYINETEQAYKLKEPSNDVVIFNDLEELKKKKIEIMIEALYSRYFEPIDEKLLHGDMETQTMMSGTNYSDVQCEESLMRLENPVEAYCVPKKK